MTDLEVGGAEGGLAVGHVLAACHSRCQQAHARQLVSRITAHSEMAGPPESDRETRAGGLEGVGARQRRRARAQRPEL